MIIQLASCNKKKNSTLVNGIWNMTKECSLKNPTSIMTPVVTIYDTTDQMQRFNYAYIPDFGRYYFIDDIIFEDTGNVTLTMSIDVLASYRDEIINSQIYYLRSPWRVSNPFIMDSFFPISTKAITRKQLFHIPDNIGQYYPETFDQGYYIVITTGIENESGTTGQTIYQLTPAQFKSVINNLLAIGDDNIFGNLAQGIINAIYTPMDFVVSCFWSPIKFPTAVGIAQFQRVYFGRWDSEIVGQVITGDTATLRYQAEVMQPFGVADKPYRMQKPFSRFIVSLGFVPDFEIDGALLWDGNENHQALYVDVTIEIDPTTGLGVVQAYPAYFDPNLNTTMPRDNTILANIHTQVLVPVNLASTKNNMAMAGSNIISGAVSVATGNVIGAVTSFASAGIDTAANAITGGTVSSVMPNGSLIKHATEKALIMQFFDQVGTDDDFGYPCCKKLAARDGNTGFYKGMDVHLTLATATREETQLAEALIETGYFYQ